MNTGRFLFLCVSCTILWMSGCQEKKTTDESKPYSYRNETGLPLDSEFGTSKDVEFLETSLRVCTRTSADPAFEKLPDTAREAATRLQNSSCRIINIFFTNDRALFVIPPALGQGRTLELVMNKDPGPAALVDRGEKRFWWGEPAKLLDVLEGTPHRFRTRAWARFLDTKEDPDFVWNDKPTDRLDAVIEYGVKNPGRLPPHDVRIDLVIWSTVESPEDESLKQLLLYSSLMSLGGNHGWEAIKEVCAKTGFPLRWKTTVRPRHWPEDRKSVTFIYEIMEQQNGRLTKTTILPANRAALPPAEFQRRFGPIGSPDRQEIPEKLLKPLRAPTGIPDEPRTGEFAVVNKTDRSAAILLDGYRVGIVSPGGQQVFKGFPAGYYRASAHSPWATTSFGPVDTYIPGKWTLMD